MTIVRRVVLIGLAIVLVAAALVGLEYRRQIVAWLTHRKGGPETTVAYEPYPQEPLVHLAVAGDTGDSGTRLDRTGAGVARVGEAQPFDALLLLGDNVYPSGDPDRLPATVFEPFADVLAQSTDLLAILGNHDVVKGRGEEQMDDLGMEGRWWSRRYGPLLIVGLDSNDRENPEQIAFLEDALRTTDAPWRIVALHHPPYSAGYQGSSLDIREVYSPIFAEHGVQLVLSGHDHDYQRSKVIDGVTYVVSGAGSGTRGTGEDDFTAVSYSWLHFTDIAVFDDELVLRSVNPELRVADEARIPRNT